MLFASRKLMALSLLFVSSVAPDCRAFQSQDSSGLNLGSIEAVSSILAAGAFNRLRRLGYSNSNARAFKIKSHASWTAPLEVKAGQTYFILGGCDSKCHDINLELFTLHKMLLGADTLKDNYPIVQYVAEKTENLILRMNLEQCDTGTCWGGVIIMKKATSKASIVNKALE